MRETACLAPNNGEFFTLWMHYDTIKVKSLGSQHMPTLRLLSASAIALAVLCSSASAQSLRNAKGPANLPPASFKGPQFVDNRGCAYIRAGAAGRVSWVPRVTQSRQQLCGLQPTFGDDVAQEASPKKTRVVRTTTVVAATSGALSSQRAGPRGVNRRIVESQLPAVNGYEPAWADGRLNPQRGVGTATGKGQMNLIWSNTVPRYLIDPETGKPARKGKLRLFGG